jgi:uncharacterized protein (TIGR02266 family)
MWDGGVMERKKVVLADDVELFLMLENTFFNRDEFEMITARSGREVLKVIREAKPDLVFMDLDMPGMNGDECCRVVKRDAMNSHIPVIMVTRKGRKEAVERCRDAGCDGIVFKPIDRGDLLALSRKYLHVKERGAQRINARLAINYAVMSSELRKDYSMDLNSGGMFLETVNPLEIDTMLYIEFTLPAGDRTIRCQARVAWVNQLDAPRKPQLPAGVGVQFLSLGQADMEAIQGYIETGEQ